jgi:hypothetical protein
MTTRVCPHCNINSHFTEIWSDQSKDAPEAATLRTVYESRFLESCDNCRRPVVGMYFTQTAIRQLWPTVVHRKIYDDVPEAIAGAASEAHQALGADAPRAAVAMARAVVEATAKEKGITQGRIQSKIDQLAANGHISEPMREAAHEIRLTANEAAHGDLVEEPISIEEATEVVELMDAILERVYQEPAKVARVRASREARRNSQEPAQAAG